jgi:methionine aminopeptidase
LERIKLHGLEAFAGMRKAGRLVAECLDRLVPEIRSGVTTEHIDRLVFECHRLRGYARDVDVSRLCQIHLHVKMATSTAT